MDNLYFETNYEPMDIDMSAHSNNEMDISYNNTSDDGVANQYNILCDIDPLEIKDEPMEPTALCDDAQQSTTTNVKKYHIILHKESKTWNIPLITKVCCALVFIFISIITYQVLNIQCSNNISPEELRKSLGNKLYGQSRATHSLIEALNVEEEKKLLFFYGGTGVGKTYMASLILEHIGYYSNVYHYIMPSFVNSFTTDFMVGFTVCKHTTVIVDDLDASNMEVKAYVKELITKSESLHKNITIILIFNCDKPAKHFERHCDDTFANQLLEKFYDIDAFKMLIKFDTLKEEHLRRCIDNELGTRKLNDLEFQKVSNNFNVSLDGCKGVYTKIKLLEIS